MSSLGLVIRIAWRNLGRNRRRTLITGAGIALGAALCIGAVGILDGLDLQIVRSVTDGELGHLQVHAPDYMRSRKLKDAFDRDPFCPRSITRRTSPASHRGSTAGASRQKTRSRPASS